MYGTGDVKLVVGWISSGNTAKTLRSNKCVDVNTPLNKNRGDPTLWSKEMPGNLESLVSSFVITNPSIEPGTRIVFVKPNGKKEGNCVQVLTVMNLSPIVGTVRITRIELQVANSYFGGDRGFRIQAEQSWCSFMKETNSSSMTCKKSALIMRLSCCLKESCFGTKGVKISSQVAYAIRRILYSRSVFSARWMNQTASEIVFQRKSISIAEF